MATVSSTSTLFLDLCHFIVEERERKEKTKWHKDPLKLPDHLFSNYYKRKEDVIKLLYRTAFDLLLLRRSEWYGQWRSPLEPTCRCLAHGYILCKNGRYKDAQSLTKCVGSLEDYDGCTDIFTFLSILATLTDNKLNDSGIEVCFSTQ